MYFTSPDFDLHVYTFLTKYLCDFILENEHHVPGPIHWWKYEPCQIIWACHLDWSLGKSLGEFDLEQGFMVYLTQGLTYPKH
jgi:hypothetical protein